MDSLLILFKASLSLYFILDFVQGKFKHAELSVLLVLAYVFINMFYYFVPKPIIKKMLLLISLVIIIFSGIYINFGFFFFLPLNLIEMQNYYYSNIMISIFLLFLSGFILVKSRINEYVFISIISLLIYYYKNYFEDRLKNSEQYNDKLRIDNERFNRELNCGYNLENQMKYTTKLEERNKIAQEIHDKLGHSMSGSIMQLEAAKLIVKTDPKISESMIENTIIILRQGMEDIRTTLKNIKPEREQLGVNKLILIIDRYKVSCNSTVNFTYSGQLDVINYHHWKVICENVKECLTNSSKYSNGTSISIKIEVLNMYIKTEVKDNGIGQINIKKGLGLRGIEERTQDVNGKVIIDGSSGFSVISLIPY